MSSLGFIVALLSLTGAANATLKPIEADFHPLGNKAVTVYKTTPSAKLKVYLYFPPDWSAADRRPAIVFFCGGGCATGSPAQFSTTAEYFATRGLVAASAEYRITTIHHPPPERCAEDGKSSDSLAPHERTVSGDRRNACDCRRGLVGREMEYIVNTRLTGVLTCRRWPRRRCALSGSEPVTIRAIALVVIGADTT